jgi:hypothetical protein
MTRLLALMAILFVAGTATAVAGPPPQCKGTQLEATFAAVPGSAGAGNITYKLVAKNISTHTCVVTGLPHGRLLGKTGKALPTTVWPAKVGQLTAVLVTLKPGRSTFATARFSPDVPGPGEPVVGRACEPTAWFFRLQLAGGGTAKAKLAPPTPVCEHGRLFFSAYSVARR